MDAIKQRVNKAYNERFGQVLVVISAISLIIWSTVVYAAYVHPEQEHAPLVAKISFLVICFFGWGGFIIGGVCLLECWLREKQVRRPYDPLSDGIPLDERGPRIAVPPAAQN